MRRCLEFFILIALRPDDEMVVSTMMAVEDTLSLKTEFGGVARFENDDYVRVSNKITGNPWFICTLWLADYYLALAKSKEDLARVVEILDWTVKRALPSGILAEQLDPLTGAHVSVSPLTWSHSTFVATVCRYLIKVRELSD